MKETDGVKNPVPLIDLAVCDGCGLCVRICLGGALSIINGKAVVIHPEACKYHGYCERICPGQAITRRFQIIFYQEKEA